jgi:hypothetical protein
MMFTASSVRTPVSAGSCGFRAGVAGLVFSGNVIVAFNRGPDREASMSSDDKKKDCEAACK